MRRLHTGTYVDNEEIKRQVWTINWWHKIDLGNGITTPGRDESQAKLRRIGMRSDLTGKSVLDIGAWDGFFSFEAERRKASRVVALDYNMWVLRGQKKGFDLARRILGSKVEDVEMDVMDMSPEKLGGSFDYVLFLGVLYHLRHPLLGLEKVSSVTREQLVLETEIDLSGIILSNGKPCMRFYPDSELMNDPNNWWGPNVSAVIAMLKNVGFKNINLVSKTPLHRRIGGAILNKGHSHMSFIDRLQIGRVVIHAWK
jgi:tRNA (mo5U34)-methyltransferase